MIGKKLAVCARCSFLLSFSNIRENGKFTPSLRGKTVCDWKVRWSLTSHATDRLVRLLTRVRSRSQILFDDIVEHQGRRMHSVRNFLTLHRYFSTSRFRQKEMERNRRTKTKTKRRWGDATLPPRNSSGRLMPD